MDEKIFYLSGPALKALQVHELCALVPPSAGRVRGTIERAIVLLDGAIVDGRARRDEAMRLSEPCPCVNYDAAIHGPHPGLFVASATSERMKEPHRLAAVGARIAHFIHQRPECLRAYEGDGWARRIHRRRERQLLANAIGVNMRTFEYAWPIRDERLLAAVLDGDIAIRYAFDLHRLDLTATRVHAIIVLPTRAARHAAIKAKIREAAELEAATKARQLPLWKSSAVDTNLHLVMRLARLALFDEPKDEGNDDEE